MSLPLEENMHEFEDRTEMMRSVGAFLYALIGAKQIDPIAVVNAVRLVEDMNLEKQRVLFTDANLLYFCHGLADRLLVPMCDHEGDHDPSEWAAGLSN